MCHFDQAYDQQAIGLFEAWLGKCYHGIPLKIEFGPTEYYKLLSNILLETIDPMRGESYIKLRGEFFREIYPPGDSVPATELFQKTEYHPLISDWDKSDHQVYVNHKPTIHFFSFRDVKGYMCYLAELSLPIRIAYNEIESINYSWRIDESRLRHLFSLSKAVA